MSGIGFWELIFLFLIGLIVLGPERLPRVAHQLGSWLGQARRMTRVMRRQLEDELNLEQSINPPRRPLPAPPAKEDDYEPVPRPDRLESESVNGPASEEGGEDGGPAGEPSAEPVDRHTPGDDQNGKKDLEKKVSDGTP